MDSLVEQEGLTVAGDISGMKKVLVDDGFPVMVLRMMT